MELLPKVKTLPSPGAEGAEDNRGLLIFGGLPTGDEVLGTARNDLSSLERRCWEQWLGVLPGRAADSPSSGRVGWCSTVSRGSTCEPPARSPVVKNPGSPVGWVDAWKSRWRPHCLHLGDPCTEEPGSLVCRSLAAHLPSLPLSGWARPALGPHTWDTKAGVAAGLTCCLALGLMGGQAEPGAQFLSGLLQFSLQAPAHPGGWVGVASHLQPWSAEATTMDNT